jgi:hypothetical protein
LNEQAQRAALHCPECGAPGVSGTICWEMLELLAEHFLTVASYNLQHPTQFTEAALSGRSPQARYAAQARA